MVRGRHRYASLALALIALELTASFAGLEAAAVRHAVCIEHGAAIDVPLAAPAAAVDPDDDYSDDNLAGHERPRVLDHDHCALAACAADAVAPEARLALAVPAPPIRHLLAVPAVAPPRAVRLLSIAPKTSPPG
jgi:hypothetical protein